MEDTRTMQDRKREERLQHAGDTVNALMRSGRGVALDIGSAARIAAVRHSDGDILLEASEIVGDVRARSAAILSRLTTGEPA